MKDKHENKMQTPPENKQIKYDSCFICGKKLLGDPKIQAFCSDVKCDFKMVRNKPVIKKGCKDCGNPIRVEMK